MQFGIFVSRVSKSPENRDRMRPNGEVSKNICGALMMRLNRQLCNASAAHSVPILTRSDAPYTVSTARCVGEL